MRAHVLTNAHGHAYAHSYMHAYAHAYTHTSVHMYVHTHDYAHLNTRISMHFATLMLTPNFMGGPSAHVSHVRCTLLLQLANIQSGCPVVFFC